VHRRHRETRERGFEARPPLALGRRPQVLVVEGEQVPGDVRGGRLRGQHLDPRRGRVDPEQECLEIEPSVACDHDLAIDDAAIRERGPQRRAELGEVAVEGLQVA